MFHVDLGEALQDRVLQASELFVGDDEKIPRATSRVEDLDRADAPEERFELPCRVVGDIELFLQPIEEQGLDGLEDVRHGGVVLAEIRALARGDDRLEHRPEDVRVDLSPDQGAGFDEQVSGPLRERRDHVLGCDGEESPVDVWESGEVSRTIGGVFGVECGEEVGEELCDVGAVGLGV